MNTQRKNIMIGTAGHVDHGKSALVKLLTGCETDTLAEEKQRGLTIDLGFASCRFSGDRVVGIVDVPGHVDFIRNMVAGAHGIDIVMLVVAADDGIMPQTREHLHILTLMGLRHGVVALTKVDLVDPVRRSFVVEDLRCLLTGTFLADAPICPLSNITGEGFDGFFEALNSAVDACRERTTSGIFRMWVEDVFTIRGSGTVITGIPSSGMVRVGDELTLLPGELPGHVRRMQVYGEDAREARAGECVAINIPEIDHQVVRRGMVLAGAGTPPAVTMAEGELHVLAGSKATIRDYLEVQLHVGTAAVSARVAMLETDCMTGGQKQLVQLRFEEPLPLVPGERFVVRANLAEGGQSGLTTFGGGRLLSVSNVRLRRKKPWVLETLAARSQAMDEPMRWCELMLRESGEPLSVGQLELRCQMHSKEVLELLAKLSGSGKVVELPGKVFLHVAVREGIASKVLATLQQFHTAQPQRVGLERQELLSATNASAPVFESAIASLVADKRIEFNGTVFAQKGWKPNLPDPEEQLCNQIAAAFLAAGWTSPAAAELAVSLRQAPDRVEKKIRLLVERSVLVRLDERVFMHRQALEAGKKVVLQLFARAPQFSTMDFRDALGVSRKYAVPLLDYLDKIRFTVRNGNTRTPGVEAKKLMA